MLLCVLAPSRW